MERVEQLADARARIRAWAPTEARHEFTNSLAALLVAAETLRDRRGELPDQAIDDLVQLVHGRADRLRRLLLELEEEHEDVPAQAAPQRVVVVVEDLVREHLDATEAQVDVETDLLLVTDPGRLARILHCLVIEAAGPGDHEVRLTARDSGASVTFTISGDGTRVDPTIEAAVHDRYEGGTPRVSRQFGLASVRPMVDALRGQLRFDGGPGRSRFTLILPRSEGIVQQLGDSSVLDTFGLQGSVDA